jgi:hypothetical protein
LNTCTATDTTRPIVLTTASALRESQLRRPTMIASPERSSAASAPRGRPPEAELPAAADHGHLPGVGRFGQTAALGDHVAERHGRIDVVEPGARTSPWSPTRRSTVTWTG